jgi:hypothetical protein
VALYRGETIGAAKIVAVSANPELVSDFATRMLSETEESERDAVLRELESGRRSALRIARNEANG